MMKQLLLFLFCLNIFSLSAQTDVPVAGLKVILEQATDASKNFVASTDMQGNVAFEKVPQGEYRLYLDMDGTKIPVNSNKRDYIFRMTPGSTDAADVQHALIVPMAKDNLKVKVHQFGHQMQVQIFNQPTSSH